MNRAASKKPSPRLASVVMETQTAAAVAAMPCNSAAVACVACTRHQCAVEHASIEQQLDRPPARGELAGLHLFAAARRRGCAAAVRHRFAAAPGTASRSVVERHGAQAVKRGAGAQGHGRAAAPLRADPLFDRSQKVLGIHREARLLALERLGAEVAGLVERRQEREPDAGGCGGPVRRHPTGRWSRDTARRRFAGAGNGTRPPRCSRT